MKNLRFAAVGTLVAILLTSGLAQKAAQHLLSNDELKNVIPAEFFFRGQKAPTQLRNSSGFQTADGKITFGALVDVSGYSTAVQQKYQGMIVTESKLNIGGSELAPGEYGLVAHRDGYTDRTYVVERSDFVDQKELPIELYSQAVISGRVTNSLGSPLQSAQIQALGSRTRVGKSRC